MLRVWGASQSRLWTHQSIRISQLISPVYSIHVRRRQISRSTRHHLATAWVGGVLQIAGC